ncbi:MAG: polyprenyl synthetase family protein [Candidatus Ancillula sp.]|jgi:geranylgeranyl diphosphate synthase type I|nr:polyprenyl synthetase family protein [Candidatus Ancillula sp.]
MIEKNLQTKMIKKIDLIIKEIFETRILAATGVSSKNLANESSVLFEDSLKRAYLSCIGGKHVRSLSFLEYMKYDNLLNNIKGKDVDDEVREGFDYISDIFFRIAACFEIFHSAALIHDDIVDNDDVRRGKPALHAEVGNSKAILIGDLMYQVSNLEFVVNMNYLRLDEFIEDSEFSAALIEYNIMQTQVQFGQILDLELENTYNNKKLSVDKKIKPIVEDVMRLKTASYTFVGPRIIGAIIAGENQKGIEEIRKQALKDGREFQVANDLVDIEQDKKEGKVTLPILNEIEDLETK